MTTVTAAPAKKENLTQVIYGPQKTSHKEQMKTLKAKQKLDRENFKEKQKLETLSLKEAQKTDIQQLANKVKDLLANADRLFQNNPAAQTHTLPVMTNRMKAKK